MRHVLITGLLLAIAAPALASDKPPSTAAQPGDGKDRLICRRENMIGSIIPNRRKMCLTKAEWDKREYDGNEMARKMVQDNAGKCSSSGC